MGRWPLPSPLQTLWSEWVGGVVGGSALFPRDAACPEAEHPAWARARSPSPAVLRAVTGRGLCLPRVRMTEVEPVLDFASSGRTGRRNALPDILGSPAGVSPSDLPLKLAEMSLTAGG